jgi:hypothetical protein
VLKGIQMTLMIGPVVPIPVPQVVLDALESVQVTVRDEGASVFELNFSLSNRSPLQTIFLLTGGASQILFMRVVIVVTVNGTPNVIMDGVITTHQIAPGNDAGHSRLTITGEDLSAVMNQIDFSGFPFPAMPAEARVAILCAKYAMFGIIPLVIPSVLIDVPLPTGNIPSQQGTDLAYIKALADRVGYVFYIDPGPAPGVSVAYWGPQIKVGVPQPALNINMDAHTNVETLSFQFDNQKNKIPTFFYYNEQTGIPIPIPLPPITPLNPPLGLIPPIPTGLEPVSDNLSKRTVAQGIMMGLAKASKLAEAVTGNGTLDVLRYGRVLKPRNLVGVRGVGPAFDGLHYVKSVTHQIKRGEYKQSFSLSRNGLLSTLPRVPA